MGPLVWPPAYRPRRPRHRRCTPQGFLERLDDQNVMLEALMKKDVLATLCCPLAQDPVPGAAGARTRGAGRERRC